MKTIYAVVETADHSVVGVTLFDDGDAADQRAKDLAKVNCDADPEEVQELLDRHGFFCDGDFQVDVVACDVKFTLEAANEKS